MRQKIQSYIERHPALHTFLNILIVFLEAGAIFTIAYLLGERHGQDQILDENMPDIAQYLNDWCGVPTYWDDASRSLIIDQESPRRPSKAFFNLSYG